MLITVFSDILFTTIHGYEFDFKHSETCARQVSLIFQNFYYPDDSEEIVSAGF